MRERRITGGTPPLTLAEAKAFLRVDSDHEDTLITALISAATARVERETGRVFGPQTWEAIFGAFPARDITLGKVPVTEIVSVTYIDADGLPQVVDPAEYEIAEAAFDGQILLLGAWPAAKATANAVVVRYEAGDGWPDDVVEAVRLIVGHWYANRETAVERGLSEIPLGACHILGMHWRPFV